MKTLFVFSYATYSTLTLLCSQRLFLEQGFHMKNFTFIVDYGFGNIERKRVQASSTEKALAFMKNIASKAHVHFCTNFQEIK